MQQPLLVLIGGVVLLGLVMPYFILSARRKWLNHACARCDKKNIDECEKCMIGIELS